MPEHWDVVVVVLPRVAAGLLGCGFVVAHSLVGDSVADSAARVRRMFRQDDGGRILTTFGRLGCNAGSIANTSQEFHTVVDGYQHPHVLDRKTRSRIITSDPQPRLDLRGDKPQPQRPQYADTDTAPIYGAPSTPTMQFDMHPKSAVCIANAPPCKERPLCSLRLLDVPDFRYLLDRNQLRRPLCASKMALSTASIPPQSQCQDKMQSPIHRYFRT